MCCSIQTAELQISFLSMKTMRVQWSGSEASLELTVQSPVHRLSEEMNRNEKCSTIFDMKRQLHRLTCSDYMRRRTLFNCSGTCELLMTRTKMTRMAVEFYWTILTDFLLIETLGKLTPDVCLVAKDC